MNFFAFQSPAFELWFTIIVFLGLLYALIREKAPAEYLLFGALLLLVFGGVISLEDALSGFSHPVLLTIGALFILVGALQATGMLRWLGFRLLQTAQQGRNQILVRFLPFVMLLSMFLSNTVIVAIFLPILRQWARQYGKKLSQYLIPLSYTAILGGMCTLIGTSTNLLVDGYMTAATGETIGFFTFAIVGIPLGIIGLVYLILIAPRLLPDRGEILDRFLQDPREYVVEAKVTERFPGIGKTVEEAGLRHLQGVFLFQIERNGEIFAPVSPDERVFPGDHLFFTGLPDMIMDLRQIPGLQLLPEGEFQWKQYDSERIRLFEVVVSHTSPLIGRRVRDSGFRAVYDAVILAIHRNGERIRQKIGDVVLQAGDTLLLLAPRDFYEKWYYSRDFYLVSEAKTEMVKPESRGYAVLAFFFIAILLTITNVLALPLAFAAAALASVFIGAVGIGEMKQVVDWSVLLIIGTAFGIGKAIHLAGVDHAIVSLFQPILNAAVPLLPLFALFLLTNLLTELMTNVAAAAIALPIAESFAAQMNVPFVPLALIVAIAASASFATPIGYQTNLLIYGSGNYRFSDFLRVGLPLNVVSAIVTVVIVYLVYFS